MQLIKQKILKKAMFLFLTLTLLLPLNFNIFAADEDFCAFSECHDCIHSENDETEPNDDEEDEIIMRASTECQWYGHNYGAPQTNHSGSPCYTNTYLYCNRAGCGYYQKIDGPTLCSIHNGIPECLHPGYAPGTQICAKCHKIIGAGSCPLCHMC
ncbi:MAG: hypothetical protein FWG34_02270 [Oscillospiraceae bacterium]|nr:hypothetical protein [Oscillospiraceae bacterium]